MKINSLKWVTLLSLICLIFGNVANATEPELETDGPWNVGFGIGPNITQFDVVNDDLGSSLGAALWLTRRWGDYNRLELSLDYFRFNGANQDYYGLSAAYGLEFFKKSPFKAFGMLGLGLGRANNFPRAVNPHQQPPHLFARIGMDELYQYKQWTFGLIFDYMFVDLDDKPATQAQLGLPMVSVVYQFKNGPTPSNPPMVVHPPADEDNDGVVAPKDECPNTPHGVRVNSIGCPIKTKVRKELRVEFETNKSVIKAEYLSKVKAFAHFLNENTDIIVTIEGHTDSVGSRNYNLKLSQQRADSVRRSLIELGNVLSNRIKAIGYGPDQPESTNSTTEGRTKNRRVIAVLSSD
jgi:outer membrane protein OmpA-like peptidoglycan-associated protein